MEVDMKIYSLILFLHVVGAFGILVSLGLEWFGLNNLQRSCTAEESRASMKNFGVLPRIGGPSYLLALLPGIYLWETSWRGTAWTVTALISLVVIAVIGAVLTRPRMTSLEKALSGEAGRGSFTPRFASMQVLWVSLQVRTLMAFGITFLMTVKPDLAGSAITMIIAILLGLAMNPATMSYYRDRDVCAVSNRK